MYLNPCEIQTVPPRSVLFFKTSTGDYPKELWIFEDLQVLGTSSFFPLKATLEQVTEPKLRKGNLSSLIAYHL